MISPELRERLKQVPTAPERAELVEQEGGNIYDILHAMFSGPDAKGVFADTVTAAVMTIRNENDIKSFIDGYVEHVSGLEYPPENPTATVIGDLDRVLMYCGKDTRDNWKAVISQYQ